MWVEKSSQIYIIQIKYFRNGREINSKQDSNRSIGSTEQVSHTKIDEE